MILTTYFTRRFLVLVGMVFAIFFGVLLLVDVIEQLRRHAGQDIGMQAAVILALLNVPESLYKILPLITILAAIAMFLGLARSSELVVLRASGRSGLRFLIVPVVAAMVIGVFAVAVLNPLVAATRKSYDVRSASAARDGQAVLSISGEGLWLRQGSAGGQTVIRAARASLDGIRLLDVTFQTFSTDGAPMERLEARVANLEPGHWRLEGVKRWPLDAANPERAAIRIPGALTIPTDLTQERLREGIGTPSAIAFWQLPHYIAELETAGFSARSHRVWMQMELALPLLLAAMVLVAAGFTMRHARTGKTGNMVMLALLGGFVIFFVRNFAQVLGENGQIPIAAAAWTPPVAAVLTAMGLLLHMEDG